MSILYTTHRAYPACDAKTIKQMVNGDRWDCFLQIPPTRQRHSQVNGWIHISHVQIGSRIRRLWDSLHKLNQNDRHAKSIEQRLASEQLEKDLFYDATITNTGRVRGRANYTQRRNTPFQAAAADGAKLALWELYKAGYQVVAFVHDEFVIQVPIQDDYSGVAEDVNQICCEAQQSVCPNIPFECKYAISRCWSKEAQEVRDSQGRLTVWEPTKTEEKVPHDLAPAKTTQRRQVEPNQSRLKPKQFYKPLKWHGGKDYLAKKLIELMPAHTHYVEPYFGGGAVLLSKNPEGVSEVANDIYGELTNFWLVLQDKVRFHLMQQRLLLIPLSEIEFERVTESADDEIERAARFFVRNRQSRQGLMKDFATMSRTRTRRGMNEQVSSYLGAIEGLSDIHNRLQRVVIKNRDAINVIQQEDGAKTLFYLDPPYLHETRVTTKDYEFEMTTDDHAKLLDAVMQCKGKVMLSGYPSEIYDSKLKSWNKKEIRIDNKASSKKIKEVKTEIVWMNY